MKLGIRTDDAKSGSSALSRNRTISTYYHHIEKLGLAEIHILRIYHNVSKATDEEPHQLVASFRATGGDEKLLEEHLVDAKRQIGNSGNASRYRIFRNSDGSLDAELRIETNGDFKETLQNFGDVSSWPRSL